MITVTLYSREDCHLCQQAREDLDALQDRYPHQLTVVDVDSTLELQRAYGFEVPVLEVGPYKLKAPFTRQEVAMTLGAARDRQDMLAAVEDKARREAVGQNQKWTRADAFSYWFASHYLAMFNLFILIYVGLPVLAPMLMKAGATAPAGLIYRSYGMVCHQLSFRSFFLFGEQPVYPRAEAGLKDLLTYQQATGNGETSSAEDLLNARAFVGNPQMGYKIALCERDVAIYGAILLFGVIFVATGRRIPPLPWYLWLLVGLAPIGLDGVSQLLSQPPFNFIPYRESTPYLRSLTGALFGWTTAWFGYPLVEETMRDTRQILAAKMLRVKGSASRGEKPA